MANEAACGLMLWDGHSKGTFNSMSNMICQGKPVAVYLAPKQRFHNLHSSDDLMDLLSSCDPARVQRLERELGIAHALHRALLP